MSEQDEQVVEATISDEVVELEQTTDTEDVEALKAQIAEKDNFARQAVARAKKAEAELKELKTPKVAVTQNTTNTLSEETLEAKILVANGMDPELVEELRKVAQVRGKSLLESQNDPIFVAIKSQRENDAKTEKAKLGASRGSATIKQEKSVTTPGLSEDEHKAMWKSQQGK